jgi:hypothetical protein
MGTNTGKTKGLKTTSKGEKQGKPAAKPEPCAKPQAAEAERTKDEDDVCDDGVN